MRPNPAMLLALCLLSARLAAADPTPAQLLEKAEQAAQAGQHLQAGEHLRRILLKDPNHEKAYQQLLAISPKIKIPADEIKRKQWLEKFGEGFSLHATDHFLLVHNTADAWARQQGRLMERAHRDFFAAFSKAGFRPWPLARRQVCVLFEDHADFAAHALKTDKIDMSRFGGYYSPRFNRTLFFNEKTNPQVHTAQQRVLEIQDKITGLKKQLAETSVRAIQSRLQVQIAKATSELTRARAHRMLVRTSIANANAAKTTHETVHQLAYNTGLQTRGVMHPFWLSEGMATNFELLPPATEIGPHRINSGRKVELVEARRNGRLEPLARFIIRHRPSAELARAKAEYAQAWALFRFLFRTEPQKLNRYMKKLAAMKPGRRPPQKLAEEFIEVFGPTAPLQQAFDRRIGLYR